MSEIILFKRLVRHAVREDRIAEEVTFVSRRAQLLGSGGVGANASMSSGAPQTLELPDRLMDQLRLQSEALQRVGKPRRIKNPHLGADEDSGDDDSFDIQGALAEKGLHDYDRPEHIAAKHYGPSKKACVTSLRRGVPWVSDRTSSLLKDFAPQPTDRFDLDPIEAKRAMDRKQFSGFVHFQRRNRTWAMFHVAVGALSLSDAMYWLAECEELCGAKGEHVAIRYALTRLNAAKEAIATFRRPRAQPPQQE